MAPVEITQLLWCPAWSAQRLGALHSGFEKLRLLWKCSFNPIRADLLFPQALAEDSAGAQGAHVPGPKIYVEKERIVS